MFSWSLTFSRRKSTPGLQSLPGRQRPPPCSFADMRSQLRCQISDAFTSQPNNAESVYGSISYTEEASEADHFFLYTTSLKACPPKMSMEACLSLLGGPLWMGMWLTVSMYTWLSVGRVLGAGPRMVGCEGCSHQVVYKVLNHMSGNGDQRARLISASRFHLQLWVYVYISVVRGINKISSVFDSPSSAAPWRGEVI